MKYTHTMVPLITVYILAILTGESQCTNCQVWYAEGKPESEDVVKYKFTFAQSEDNPLTCGFGVPIYEIKEEKEEVFMPEGMEMPEEEVTDDAGKAGDAKKGEEPNEEKKDSAENGEDSKADAEEENEDKEVEAEKPLAEKKVEDTKDVVMYYNYVTENWIIARGIPTCLPYIVEDNHIILNSTAEHNSEDIDHLIGTHWWQGEDEGYYVTLICAGFKGEEDAINEKLDAEAAKAMKEMEKSKGENAESTDEKVESESAEEKADKDKDMKSESVETSQEKLEL